MTALREIFARFQTRFDGTALVRGQAQTQALTSSLRTLGALVAGSFLVVGIRNFIGDMIEMGDELDKTSGAVGINAQALQAWRLAADLSGVETGQFNMALIRLQKSMFDAGRGSAEARDGFAALGISVKDAEGQLRPVEDVLLDLADPLSELESNTERTALLTTLLGRSGARLAPLFAEGREGVEALVGELGELGGGASEEFIQAAADMNDANTRLSAAWLSLKSRIGVFLLPALQSVVEAITEGVGAFRELIKDSAFVEASLLTLKGVAIAAGLALLVAFGPALLTFGLLAAGVLVVILFVDDLIVHLRGGQSVIGEFAQAVEDFAEMHRGDSGPLGDIIRFWESLDGLLEAVLEKALQVANVLTGFRVDEETADALGVRSTDALEARSDKEREIDARGFLGRLGTLGVTGLTRFDSRIVRGGDQVRGQGATAAAGLTRTSQRGIGPPPVVVQQENNTNITATGAEPREVTRLMELAIRRRETQQMEEAAEALTQAETP